MADKPKLTQGQRDILEYLDTVEGADFYQYGEAKDVRALEAFGYVTVTRPRTGPANGAMRQPYMGASITPAGRDRTLDGLISA